MADKVQYSPNRAAFDVRSAQDLRAQLKDNPKEGLKAAAQQFEAMFLQMVMKSMRDATPQDGLFSSEQSRFYTSLLDQQMAQNMSSTGKGVGFARLIEQQLGQTYGVNPDGVADEQAGGVNTTISPLPMSVRDSRHLQHETVPGRLPTSADYPQVLKPAIGNKDNEAPASANDFVSKVWPSAVEASRSTGIPPQFLIAQAALESGWGKSEVKGRDGSGSYNLFGIKAGKNWNGPTVEAKTTEYVDGQPQVMVESFRAYSSYEESFRDFANLLRSNPRYSSVIGSQDGTEFARRMQQAGYATDPMYADKLSRIINGPTLKQALIG